jgi:hypothetical protein
MSEDMRKLFLGVSAAVLIGIAGYVVAQTAEDTAAAASQPDQGTKLRLAAMDTSATAFRKLDADNDGRISPLEAAANPRLAAAFTMGDKDKDGYLSKEEFEAMNSASTKAQDVDASSPSGDRATDPSGDQASNPSGDAPATGPNEATPTEDDSSPRRIRPRH